MSSTIRAGKLLLVGSVVLLGTLSFNTNAASAATNCIDASNGHRDNLVVDWPTISDVASKTTANVTVSTKDHRPLCDDVTVYLSDYLLPDNYNGQKFSGNPTASPQTVFDTDTAVLAKGTDGTTTLTVNLPAKCKPTQLDLYYGPDEIKTVGPTGHRGFGIKGQIFQASQETCDEGGKGGNEETPPTPITPATPQAPVATPTEQLTDTGASSVIASLIGAANIAAGVLVARKRVS